MMMTAGMLLLLMFSFMAAAPVGAFCAPGGIGLCGIPGEPAWAALSATSQGNYPGGNEIFDVFVVNSDQPPDGNYTVFNETLTASALPACCDTNTSIGFPLSLDPGQAILSTIQLEIPNNFTQSNFTADLVVNGALWNGTASINFKLVGTTEVYLYSPTPAGTQLSTTSNTSQTTVTITRGVGVSSSLFAVGVGMLSTVVVILLVLLARGRGRPRDAETQ
jgi:hypothetical protein